MVESEFSRLLRQFEDLAVGGMFGEAVRGLSSEYQDLAAGLPRVVRFVTDLYASEDQTPGSEARDRMTQILIMVYRDAKRRNPTVAEAMVLAFDRDFLEVQGTALLPRWTSLARAYHSFKGCAQSGNAVLIWQNAAQLVLSYNEFLDGLLGILIVCWRGAVGKRYNTNVLGNSYGSKRKELSDLTGGDGGLFGLFLRLAHPKLRNGLAHGQAWPDLEAAKVYYRDGRLEKKQYEMGTEEFLTLAYFGTYLAQAYIAALCVIIIMQGPGESARKCVPEHLRRIFEFREPDA